MKSVYAYIRLVVVSCPLTVSALRAQTISGMVTAADTGAPLPGTTVVAVRPSTSPGQSPTILRAVVDSSGGYAISAPEGQYKVCFHPMPGSLYMNPCQWGSAVATTVGASVSAPLSVSLQRGVRFIVRVHDIKQVLAQAESLPGTAISAFVTSPSVAEFPLPMIYNDGNVRDYGTIVPINIPLSVTVTSNSVALNNSAGAALSTTPMSFEVLPTDIEVTGAPPSQIRQMFPAPDAKIIHVYTAGLK